MNASDQKIDLSKRLILLSQSGDQIVVNMGDIRSVSWVFSQSVTLNYFDGRSISFSADSEAVDQLLEYLKNDDLTRMMKQSEGRAFQLLEKSVNQIPF